MASKALTWSGSSASLVSSSSSSGVKALCFAPRSLSFPAKKISPLVGVVRAQNNEDSQSDFDRLLNSFIDRMTAGDKVDENLKAMWDKTMASYRYGPGVYPPLREEEFLPAVEASEIELKISPLADDQVQRSSDAVKLNLIRRAMIAADERMSILVKKLLNCSSFPELMCIDRELSSCIMDERPKRWLDSTTRWLDSTTRWYDSTTEEEFVIYYTMPGMDASELEVTILGEKLNITFKEPEGEGADMKRALIWLYKTRIPLPPRCEREKAKAQFYNQILTVRMPRTAIDSTVPIYVPVKGD